MGSLASGQTGCLRAGTYGGPTSQIDFNNPGITITSYPGETATIAGFPYITGSGTTLSYLNFDLDNASDPWPALCRGAIAGGAHVTFGLQIDASHVTLTHSNVYVDPSIPLTSRGGGIGVGMSTTTSGDIIAYNRVHDVGFCPVEEHGIYLNKTSGIQIYGNWIYDIPAGTGIQVWDGPTNAHIYSNVIENASSCFDLGGNSPVTTGNLIEHNICANMTGVQLPYKAYCAGPLGPGCTGPDPGQPLFDWWGTGTPGSGNVMRDNLFSCTTGAHCSTSTAGSTGVALSNNVVGNPQWVDPNYQTSHDYIVASTSPATSWGLWNGDLGSNVPPTSPGSVPGAPTNVTVTPGNSQVTVKWAANPITDQVTHYDVYRTDQSQTVPWATPSSATAVDTTNIVNGTRYCYQVSAVNSVGQSGKSAPVCGTPSGSTLPSVPTVPGGLVAVPGNVQVTLSWSANPASQQVTKYYVYRTDQTFAGPWGVVTGTSFTNASAVVNGTQYCYQVSAVNAVGQSAKSAPVCASPTAGTATTVPGIPRGLIGAVSGGTVVLTWSANPASDQVTHYNVYRADQTFSGPWAMPAATTFTNAASLVPGTQYCYQLSATNKIGEGPRTSPVCVLF